MSIKSQPIHKLKKKKKGFLNKEKFTLKEKIGNNMPENDQ